MSVVALDGTKLIILMCAGGAFAAAGLWLLLRPKPERGTARVEVFGMKFESSSAGLLVFLVGAAFLALPLIVPESRRPDLPTPKPAEGPREQATAESPRPAQAAVTQSARPTQEATGLTQSSANEVVDGVEVEGNNSLASANPIELGASASGKLSPGDVDIFVVTVPPDGARKIFATAAPLSGHIKLTLFDVSGQSIGSGDGLAGTTATVSGDIDSDRYFAMVNPYFKGEGAEYLLTVGSR